MNPRKKVISRMMLSADLDSEFISGLPILEIVGNSRVLIENHQSVTSYSCKEICVKVNYGQIDISGRELTIVKMAKDQLVICGSIQSVHLASKE